MLSDDIAISHDSGGKVPAAIHRLAGKVAVLEFITGTVRPFWTAYEWQARDLNGQRGAVLRKDGEAVAALTFAYDAAGKVTDIFIVRNPEKLASVERYAIA